MRVKAVMVETKGKVWIFLAKKVIYGFALIFLLFLSAISLIYSSDGYVISVNSIGRMMLSGFAGILAIGGIWWLSSHVLEKMREIYRWAGAVFLFLSAMVFCTWWIINSANLPQSDAKSIYDIACRAKVHDLLPIAPTGSYMSLWPFQSGLVLFFETILRAVPDGNEMTIQFMYLPFMALSLLSGFMVVRKMFSLTRTRIFWCILMYLYLPYYFYVNNMYGETPSIALSFFALWMLLGYLENRKPAGLFLAGLSLAAAVAVRKNMMIFVIACLAVLTVMFLANRRKRYIIAVLFLAASMIAGGVLPRKFYEYRAKNTMGEGVPAVAYIAMGLQWSDGREPGAWNGYHSDLYMACDYDGKLTAEISMEALKDSLRYMREHPAYAVRFFYYKIVGQWAREDCTCLYSTLEFYGERTQKAWNIYRGEAGKRLLFLMAFHQSILYIGAACFCILAAANWKKRRAGRGGETGNLQNLILLVTFIGGFLFSLLWEAGSRYVMPYCVMLIPYAADGLARVSVAMEEKGKERKKHAT